MMGLLDWGNWSPDQDKNDSINQGLLAMGLNLLQARGNFGQALGQSGMVGLDAQQNAYANTMGNKSKQLQLQAAQMALKQQQEQEAQRAKQREFLQSLQSPQMQASQMALQGGGGPTVANAQQMPQVDPQAQQLFGAMQAGIIDYPSYLAATRKESSPIKLGAGEALIDPKTFKPIASNPKADDQPTAIREYQFAVSQGYPGTFEQWDTARKRAGATNVSVNTAKPLLNTVAEGLGKNIDSSFSSAQSAIGGIQTAQALKAAVDSGKIVAGPGATFRVLGLQVGQTLGVGGKDAAETLANTRGAIQSMAKAELDAAQMMKGQGQITEAERDIIRRAAAGDIDKLTAPEIRLLADSMEKTSRSKIKAHNRNLQGLKQMPEAAPLMPFYQVDEPPAYTPTAPSAAVRRYNPATGRIE